MSSVMTFVSSQGQLVVHRVHDGILVVLDSRSPSCTGCIGGVRWSCTHVGTNRAQGQGSGTNSSRAQCPRPGSCSPHGGGPRTRARDKHQQCRSRSSRQQCERRQTAVGIPRRGRIVLGESEMSVPLPQVLPAGPMASYQGYLGSWGFSDVGAKDAKLTPRACCMTPAPLDMVPACLLDRMIRLVDRWRTSSRSRSRASPFNWN